jgi:hypothetical protein
MCKGFMTMMDGQRGKEGMKEKDKTELTFAGRYNNSLWPGSS